MPPDQAHSDDFAITEAQTPVGAEELVRDNAGWMLVLAERMLNDAALAEDVVQEALISAINGLDRFEEKSSLKTWLHRITVNAALSKIRKQKRLAEQSIDEFLPEFDQYECRIEQAWTHLASAQDIAEHEEARARVADCIRSLPDAFRVVLQLRDIEGYDTGETAKLLEISEANVKVRLHRARAALKKILEPILRGEEYR